MNWLTEFSRDISEDSEENRLREAIESLHPQQLTKLGHDLSIIEKPSYVDEMVDKIASAMENGRELAQSHGVDLEKRAMLQLLAPAMAGIGRLAAGAGASKAIKTFAGSAAKDFATGQIGNAAKSGIQRAGQAIQPSSGGFKYANIRSTLAGAGSKALGLAAHNPGIAMGAMGAAAGAAFAPRDPQTGEKQYMKGALIGGGLGIGANALSGGALGNRLHSAVTGEKALLGQRAKGAVLNAQKAHPQFAPGYAASSAAPVNTRNAPPIRTPRSAAAPSVQVDPRLQKEHQQLARRANIVRNQDTGGGGSVTSRGVLGGSNVLTVPGGTNVSGEFTTKTAALIAILQNAAMRKMANRQTLTYDPQSKTFMRQHVTPDTAVGETGADVIPAGATEPVKHHISEPSRGPAPSNLASSPGPSQVYSSHGGDVLSSSPGRGLAARPQMTARPAAVPPPIPAAARRPAFAQAARPMGGPGGFAASAVKPRFPSLAGAVSLAGRR